ncbi:ornithine cyclodeaminase [alpha proteobacterium U9-1i]|nr:ornithine cyclodeaminase [alpha proteobacterium U9-1i]
MDAARMSEVLVLSGAEIRRLMRPSDYLRAMDEAFRAGDRVKSAPPMHIEAIGGAFHAKGAAMLGDRPLVALKFNGNFPDNSARGLPTIQGALLLCDAVNGAVLAIMDSIEITLKRTAATTALAARHLARPESLTLAICGCGEQARAHVEALAALFRFERGYAWDKFPERAAALAAEMRSRHGFAFDAAASLGAATRGADIIVTCTTTDAPFLASEHVSPGAFVAAIGADNPHKSEITPALMARSKVVVDVLDQCLVMGDLHHAVAADAMTAAQVHADMAELTTGAKSGRASAGEIIVFDSTGTALQDVASAAIVYERARQSGRGVELSLA